MKLGFEEEGYEEKRGGFYKVEIFFILGENGNMVFFFVG